MPLLETKGAGSAQGFGLSLGSAEPVYIENVFSTYLYTGNGSTQTITNGIDLAGKGGLVWAKTRDFSSNHALFDTVRGGSSLLQSNLTNAVYTGDTYISPFSSNGFTWAFGDNQINGSGRNYVSWTFRKQPKFFDVVTYTGNSTNRTIAHNLGSVPGTIIVKRTNTTGDWVVYHRSLGATKYVILNSTGAAGTYNGYWNDTEPTDTVFSLSGTSNDVNGTGNTYVAYLFAHNAGGFGLTGLDNVISCGSYTGNGSATGPVITLGYEPQWVMVKQSSASGQYWNMIDVMRGFDVSNGAQTLGANASDAELTNAGFGSGTPIMSPTATGFQVRSAQPATNASGATYIYIAIRRGPMKVPTSGTSVFSPSTFATGSMATRTVTTNFVVDLNISKMRELFSAAALTGAAWSNRLTGAAPYLLSSNTSAEATQSNGFTSFASNTGYTLGADTTVEAWNADNNYAQWSLRRAPGFFDVVCYTGTAPTAQNLTHNLGVAPEFIIIKRRDAGGSWFTGSMFTSTTVTRAVLNANNDQDLNSLYSGQSIFGGQPTASVFSVGTGSGANASGGTYVAYLFATLAGVSKVGSYTGTGTTLQINCGFTGGARFVMIKRTDSTGDWYVWDSARGIIAGDDPYLLLNSTAAEVTNTDYVDTYSAGFEISSTAPAAINASGGSFIFFAVA